MTFRPFRHAGLILAASFGLVACDDFASIGDGVAIESLVIVSNRAEGSEADDNLKSIVYECTFTELRVFGLFTNGSSNEFTSRAVFSSSNESVVLVSNNDLLFPSGDPKPPEDTSSDIFLAGELVPRSPGSAVITADFAGLSHSIPVEVRALEAADLSIAPAALTIAAGTFEEFTLSAQLDGPDPEPLGVNVEWAFENPSQTDPVTTVSEIGVVQAQRVSPDVQTLKPRLKLCDGNNRGPDPATVPTADVLVSAVDQLTVNSEFDGALSGGETLRRVAGTNEFLRAIAHFANGDEQDITEFVIIESSNGNSTTRPLVEWSSSDDTVGVFPPNSNQLNLFADIDGTTSITAAYRPADEPTPLASSTPFTVQAIDATITDLRVTPDTNVEIESLGVLQFASEADFSSNSGPITQTLTRHTAWSSSDSARVVVSSSPGFAGQAQSLQRVTDAGVTVDITGTATFGGATASDTVTVSVLRTQCSDGIDNDGDGKIDLEDDGCQFDFELDESAEDA